MDDTTAAVTILIEIHARAGQEEEARDALVTAIATSLKPGLLDSQVFEEIDDPGAYYAVQRWENADAFRAHMAEAAGGMAEATSMLREAPRTAILHHVA